MRPGHPWSSYVQKPLWIDDCPPVGLEFREAMSNDHGPWAPSNRMFMGHLAKRPGCQPIFSSLTSWISVKNAMNMVRTCPVYLFYSLPFLNKYQPFPWAPWQAGFLWVDTTSNLWRGAGEGLRMCSPVASWHQPRLNVPMTMQGKQAMEEKLSVQTEKPNYSFKIHQTPNVRFLKYSWKRWRRETSKLRKVGSNNQAVEVREEG